MKKNYLFKNFLPNSINEKRIFQNENKDKFCMYILLALMVILIPTTAAAITRKPINYYKEAKEVNIEKSEYEDISDINNWLILFNGECEGEFDKNKASLTIEGKENLISICKNKGFNIKNIEKIEGDIYLVTLMKNYDEI